MSLFVFFNKIINGGIILANEIKVYTGVKIAGVGITTDGRMKVDIGGANINATIGDISLKNVEVTADKRLKVDSSSTIENFTFADAVTIAGNKTYSGTGKKEITITFFGTGTTAFNAKLISNGIKLPVQGFRETGEPALLDSFVVNEIVTIVKPPASDLELSWTLPIGGAVSAKAVVV